MHVSAQIYCTREDAFHVESWAKKNIVYFFSHFFHVMVQRKRSKEEKDRKRSNSEAKDLRSLCLKIFCFTLNKYGSHHICSQIWDIFFSSVKPLIDSFIQDISGSENPSSLLLCFVAMSKNPICISLLDGILPNIFSVLTVKTASESVTSSVLSIVENLLVLDSELDHEDDLVKKILMPHLKDLFSGLCQFFQRRRGSQRYASVSNNMLAFTVCFNI